MTNREGGLYLLKLWYDMNPSLQFDMTFQQVVDYYDRTWPDHIDEIGKELATADLSEERVKYALQAMPYPGGDQLPHWSAYGQALAGEDAASFRWVYVTDAVKATASQVESVAKVGLGVGVTALIIVGVVYLVLMSGGPRKASA